MQRSVQHQLYQRLKSGHVLGSEHHRFRLEEPTTDWVLGKLWKAVDISVTGHPEVSLLILNPDHLHQRKFVESIKQQVSIWKQIRHPHMLTVYGFFAPKGGLLFIAMEAVDGLTLQHLLEQSDHPISIQKAEALMLQTAAALDHCQSQNRLSHGLVSPDMIFVNQEGGVKVFAQGLRELLSLNAIELEPAPVYPAYQAPEAFHPGKLSHSADIYSLACICYHLLTGKAPFKSSDTEAIRVKRLLPRPVALGASAWERLELAFSTLPNERPTSATKMIRAVFREEDEDEIEAELVPPTTAPQGGQDRPTSSQPTLVKKSPIKAIILSLLLAAIGLAGGYALAYYLHHQEVQKLQDSLISQEKILKRSSQQLQLLGDQLAVYEQRNEELENSLQMASEALNKKVLIARPSPQQPTNVDIFRDQIDIGIYGPDMVVIPAGEYIMGDQQGIGDDNEKPTAPVTLSKPFALSRFEITFEQYDLFARETNRKLPDDAGWGRGNRPVINISWKDAQSYANWLAAMTRQPYRLPSEAEWEYAARAGNDTAYWWGDNPPSEQANCGECVSPYGGLKTAPVGKHAANPWGLYDMNGNVDEWVADCYNEQRSAAPRTAIALKNGDCSQRVMKGGSWFDIARLIRPASRYRHPVDSKENSWGFRIALDLPNPQGEQ